jgi:hypothetical protein
MTGCTLGPLVFIDCGFLVFNTWGFLVLITWGFLVRSEGGLPIGTTPALDDSESRESERERERERVGRHHVISHRVMTSFGSVSHDRTD